MRSIARFIMSAHVCVAMILCVHAQATAQQEGALGFYRFPALHGDTIVFAAEGDLWKVSARGGVAMRLTTHHSEETDPVISPDGLTVAFTARYEGPAEVYTMPLAGGVPVRRTYEADESKATTWTPDGQLVYTTNRYSARPLPGLVKLNLQDGTRSLVPLMPATEGAYDGSGTVLYFARPAFHNNVTKRYVGGTARDVWKFVEGAEEAVELTGDHDGESHSPMWWNGRVYFVTDRDGTMNIWSMDEDGRDVRQHTRHSGWDVKDPSLSMGRIVYHLAADLWIYDIAVDQSNPVPIRLASDFDQLREKWVTEPMQYLTSAHIHPGGTSVVLTARGRVFVVPVGAGRLVRATRNDAVRFRDVVFLPDGKTLVGLSDESGELEFTKIPANGVGAAERITNDGKILRYRGSPSPDGRLLAYGDHNGDLWVLDVETGRQRRISENREGLGNMAWSPDSRWLAYTMTALNTFSQIKLYNVEDQTTTRLTSDRVNSFDVAWDPKGDFIYFLSDRNLNSLVGSPWGPRQPEPYFDKSIEVFHLALRKGVRSPFKPDDELIAADNPEAGSGRDRDDGSMRDDPTTPIQIDLDGLELRVKQVPVASGNYSSLCVNDNALFFRARDSGPDPNTHLVAVEIDNEDVELKTIVEKVGSIEMSLDGRKLLARRGDKLYVIDAKASKVSDIDDHEVDLSGWEFSIDVRDDWRQIFVDAWRLERDYFYDPEMHGVDWDVTLEKYLPLVDRVTTRDELSDLIGRVIGELSALHTSVRGGDLRRGQEDVGVATLGARLFRAPAMGGYRVDHIYRSDPDYPDEMGPLADPDLDIHAGDVIEAVNGVGTLDVSDIGALLRNQQGRQVLLRVRSSGGGSTRAGQSRDLIVVPTTNESNLRYSDWEYTRHRIVEGESNGSIGYVHLRAMGGANITEWYRQFYPVFNRQGLIVDVRNNYGGNIDSFILEKLMRKAWMYWKSRERNPSWNMQYAFRGHMVVLIDQDTYSDGEAFADGFRRLGLGTVIGMRTWGGEIWLGSANRLTDGGLARAPSMGVYGPEGEWLIEQIGVVPDVEVDNLPHATFNGNDAQLDTAIRVLLDRIAEDPRPVPPPPPFPKRSFRYPGGEI